MNTDSSKIRLFYEDLKWMETINTGLYSFYVLFSTDVIVGMGFSREKIHESLFKMNYDEVTAIYLLLGRKTHKVSC